MALRRIPQTTRKAEADRSSMENDRTLDPTYTSEVKTVTPPPHWHNLPGLDSVRQIDETIGKSSLTDTLGVAEKSRVTTPNYSKRLPVSGSPLISHLYEFYQYTTGFTLRTELFPRRHLLLPVILS